MAGATRTLVAQTPVPPRPPPPSASCRQTSLPSVLPCRAPPPQVRASRVRAGLARAVLVGALLAAANGGCRAAAPLKRQQTLRALHKPACPARAHTCTCEPPPAECSAAQPCPDGGVCLGGSCREDPCAQHDCPDRSRPKCTPGEGPAYQPTCVAGEASLAWAGGLAGQAWVWSRRGRGCAHGSSYTGWEGSGACTACRRHMPGPSLPAACLSAECGEAAACPQGKVCAEGGCIPDPCPSIRCPEEAPDCVPGPAPDFNATCVRSEHARPQHGPPALHAPAPARLGLGPSRSAPRDRPSANRSG